MKEEPERFLLELGGDDRTGTGERVFVKGIIWPPADVLEFNGKRYKLVSFSKMPERNPNIIRGAKYLADE